MGIFFFFLMLVVPTAYTTARGLLLLVIVIAALAHAALDGWQISQELFAWVLLFVTASLFFMTLGAIHGAPGAFRVGTVYVAWPLLYLYIAGLLRRPENYVWVMRTILVGTLFACTLTVLLALEAIGFALIPISSFIGESGGFSAGEGILEVGTLNTATVIYAVSFLFGLVMLPSEYNPFKGKAWRTVMWISFLLSIVVLIVAGRRGFWVSAALSPVIAFCLVKFSGLKVGMNKTLRQFLPLAGAMVVALSVFAIDYGTLWVDFIVGFEFSDSTNVSANARQEQFYALLAAWQHHPLLGSGLGSFTTASVRDSELPWTYELTYVALLFQTGLIGVLFYGSMITWLFARGVMIVRATPQAAAVLVPFMTGLAGFLIANATNPYLQKFDYLWTLFFPLCAINAYLVSWPIGGKAQATPVQGAGLKPA